MALRPWYLLWQLLGAVYTGDNAVHMSPSLEIEKDMKSLNKILFLNKKRVFVQNKSNLLLKIILYNTRTLQ
jgi:hypothetical protein